MARRRIHQQAADKPDGPSESEQLHTPLDRARILEAVLTILEAEGLAGISMRKIADTLGVKAAALYYHVKDKEQLLHWLAERISSEVEFPGKELTWQEQLREWALRFRRALLRYRDAVPIMGATFAATPTRLAHIEYLFRILAESGFKDKHIPWLSSMLKNYVFGFVEEESRLTERAKREHLNVDDMDKVYKEQFQSLSRELYPHMARLASHTTATDLDDEFLFGIQVLLNGFEAKLANSHLPG
ncbi:TetR/AcrR family transcriptional regulator C-terminal domain-containing protein [Paenibacillus filicis]|uniref:TetR/AcrR family transcriptional regulator C-terminal domain-containing protein n=1 Tax=Paenibacillus gyeongsangnamensis TaxID=3388067 RepID=A0ABT4Q977_9BACL|nr:TetR/AcrR family transcriptional regulator C-terminal domain-containing protein [Paenibacillus filicis]MCZ8513410.1 TetR/AcrR family transcriptional regulator C-terminal domain-containing protein [Paenibacillus filicis]